MKSHPPVPKYPLQPPLIAKEQMLQPEAPASPPLSRRMLLVLQKGFETVLGAAQRAERHITDNFKVPPGGG